MTFSAFSLFLSLTFVVSASPGPVMLACMTHGARVGVKKTIAGMLGASFGNLILATASVVGLGLLVSQNEWIFKLIKWMGALYLAYMGWQIIRSTKKISTQDSKPQSTTTRSIAKDFFIIAISNPKALLYFGALYPQFIDYNQNIAAQFLILTVTFFVTDFIWFFAYALAGKKIMQWLVEPLHQTIFNRCSGGLLILVACWMAFQSNH